MPTGGEIRHEIGQTIEKLDHQIDTAIERAVELRRDGADEEVLLAETAVAVGAARALEGLTGVSWEERLETKAEEFSSGPTESQAPPPEPRRRRWWRNGSLGA